MPYIVDGNNVMGQRPGWHRDKPKARRRLLEQIAALARAKKVRITVVFDGGGDREFPEGSAYHGARILYAEPGSDADTRILRLVEASADARGITVVTSDRRLAFAVRACGAKVVRSGVFRRSLDEASEDATHTADAVRPEGGDIEEWLRYFGASSPDGR
ncbi:MAG TPA: NYN domain-containing protein [Blastocatellia bacterium]|nr:NYN domain-containing protein [Blastocatellia bacterium]